MVVVTATTVPDQPPTKLDTPTLSAVGKKIDPEASNSTQLSSGSISIKMATKVSAEVTEDSVTITAVTVSYSYIITVNN